MLKKLIVPTILTITFSFLSCSDNTTTTTSATGRGTVIAAAIRTTAPYLGDGTSSEQFVKDLTRADAWIAGSGNYEIYNLLRTYTYPDDEGVLDMSNLYKALYEIESKVNDAQATCTGSNTITEAQIVAPFTGFSTSYDYTCAYNDGTMSDNYAGGVALNVANNIYSVLYGWQWAGNANGGSVGAAQAQFDDTNKTLIYEMVNCVNCGGGTAASFTVRTYLSGNPNTHDFTIRTITRGNSGYKAIVGKGNSRDANEFMLLKYTTDGSTFSYYCMPGDSDQTDFAAATGSASVPADCTDLQTDVDALTFFTTSDAPFALSDFTSSSILLDI